MNMVLMLFLVLIHNLEMDEIVLILLVLNLEVDREVLVVKDH
jgi:hypothetical protein